MSERNKSAGIIESTSGFLKRLNIAALVGEGTAMLLIPGATAMLGGLATANAFGAAGFGWVEGSAKNRRTGN